MTEKIILDIDKIDNAASKLKAISHPVRITILEMLYHNKSMNVTEIYSKLGIQQATTSHHLNILKNKGLIQSGRHGKRMFYSLRMDAFQRLLDCINLCSK